MRLWIDTRIAEFTELCWQQAVLIEGKNKVNYRVFRLFSKHTRLSHRLNRFIDKEKWKC